MWRSVKLLGFGEALDQRTRPDHPADTQAGKRDFRETAQEYDAPGAIQLLERRLRLAAIPERAVDVVFDEHRAGNPQQRFAAVERKRDAGGILEARRNHGDLGVKASQRIDIDSIFLNFDAGESGRGLREEIAQAGVNGIFERDRIAGADENVSQEIERLLATVGDQQIVIGLGIPSARAWSSK